MSDETFSIDQVYNIIDGYCRNYSSEDFEQNIKNLLTIVRNNGYLEGYTNGQTNLVEIQETIRKQFDRV